jgi:hypothetical protein
LCDHRVRLCLTRCNRGFQSIQRSGFIE